MDDNRYAIDLSISFLKGNWALSLGVIAVLIFFNLLSLIPMIGILFMFGYSVLLTSFQIYVAKASLKVRDTQDMESIAQNSDIKSLFSENIEVAFGATLGLFTISFILITIFTIVFSFTPTFALMQKSPFYIFAPDPVTIIVLLVFLLISMWFGYVYPAVAGEVYLSKNFKGAFTKNFLIFHPTIWEKSINKEYFKLIAIWSLIVFFIALLFAIMFQKIILIPVALIGWYWMSIYSAIVYMNARKKLD